MNNIKKILRIANHVNWSLPSFIWFLWFNFFRKNTIRRNRKAFFLADKNCIIEIHKTAKVVLDGIFVLGYRQSRKIKQETGLVLEKNSELNVGGNFFSYYGGRYVIFKNAKLILGSGYTNTNARIAVKEQVIIGNCCAISDYTVIMDSDFHRILSYDHKMTKPIKIGNHVWIGNGAKVFKGVNIGDGSVIGGGAIVTKDVPSNCFAAGNPAKVIKENVQWEL